jgi:hypothetical protein
MNGSWSSVATRETWLEEKAGQASLESYKLGVAGIAAEVVLWNGESVATSFYLRLASAQGIGRETLGERLNDPETRFLPCKIDDRVELLSLKWISYLRVPGILPEVVQREELGAVRQRARVAVQSGYVLEGEFLSMLPAARSRLSDLLNACSERFLLFLAPAAVLYINRDTIVRVAP